LPPKLHIVPRRDPALPGRMPLEVELLEAPLSPSIPPFEHLYDEQFEFSWRVLRHLGLSGAALNDGCQELWLVVHRRLASVELHCDLRTWLFGIAVNVARNHRRTEARRGGAAELPPSLASPLLDPEASHAARETWTTVQRFLDTLDESDRWIFVFNLVERMSAAETALALGIEVGTVYQRVRALKRAVKSWLER